ncbi:hypothetical protein [Chitinophaga ginsengisoli]|uniref:Nuclear transport factor 2 family protein n=1 Tax=Chitinophaga ginsengisoli TaxID=363837 RepID=A0A2P8GKK9_9BACT|nr:hypothetical protein [Chitinophaga ginsengisoli]PSL34499.1 hypothetical protein CLV42_10270 [Chitinophaga ginsengisoli]
MTSQALIELTKDLIYHATHFDVPYVKEVYADKFLIANVDKEGVVQTMNKEQLVAFVQGNKNANIEPLSTKTEYHYAICDENMGMVVITRELELNGIPSRKFLTVIWENLSGRWQVVKESSIVRD